jgi:CHAT domain-containing protein/tetratricopeptide (TPR) repeat protein
MFALGTMFLKGEAGKNIVRGLELLNLAADAREENIEISSKALSNLAYLYLTGQDGVGRDIRIARSYAMRGAAQCDGFSMTIVGVSYQMEEQFVQAYAWASAAVQHSKNAQLSAAMAARQDAMTALDVGGIAKGDALVGTLPICRRMAQGENADELARLSAEVRRLHSQGKYADAIPLAERYVALTLRKHGESSAEYATAIVWLGNVYKGKGRTADAVPLYQRALGIREHVLGPESSLVAGVLSNLAELYQALGRYADAVPLYQRGLAIVEKTAGPEQQDVVAKFLNGLAELYREQGRYAEAEPLYKRSLAIREKALGPDNADVGTSLNNLALLYDAQGRYAQAEPLYERALVIAEKAHDPDELGVALVLNNLAAHYGEEGRYADAELLLKRALSIREKALGPDHEDVALSLNNLAEIYCAQGRSDEAVPLFKRSVAILEKVLGPEHPRLATVLGNFAALVDPLALSGQAVELEPIVALSELSLAIREKALGPEHPDVAQSLNNLAVFYRAQSRYADAERFFRRALAIGEKALGPEHPWVGASLGNLAELALAQGNLAQAADYWQRATKVIERRTERGLAGSEGASAKREALRSSWYFWGLIKMMDRLAPEGHPDRPRLGGEMFEKAQWAQASEAASSLIQMAARSAKNDIVLAGLVRERQDLVAEWQVNDKQLIAARSEPGKRNIDAEKSLRDRLAVIDARLKAIDARFTKDFPGYASLTSPKPTPVAQVQAQLGNHEALVLFLDTDERLKPTPEETFIWVITKDGMRWIRSELGTKALNARVASLRCGLDATLWDDAKSAERCKGLVGASPRKETVGISGKDKSIDVLPFDLVHAHQLYKALLEPVADMAKDKHLIVVPSGPLTSLPFNVLVTQPPQAAIPEALAQYRDVAWLGTSTPITVLPSVSSLKALRQFAKKVHSSKPYLGIGNPLLDGSQDDTQWASYYKDQARLARAKRCSPNLVPQQLTSARGPRSARSFVSLFRGVQADIEQIRNQAPLPETADELCEIARRLGVPDREIMLGADATEARLKDLSEQGRLAEYAIVHFATHGALSGQIVGSAEPGLILTPPPKGTEDPKLLERDDGFLTASEIAALKLDADWVILSACYTASPQGEGVEALSGMARAFFYAGSRALLVSHWGLNSDAAVKLTTRAFQELKAHPEMGRPEAMRMSMRELIEKGTLPEAHPSYWAPFIVVGEGGVGTKPLETSPAKHPVGRPAAKKVAPADWKAEVLRR